MKITYTLIIAFLTINTGFAQPKKPTFQSVKCITWILNHMEAHIDTTQFLEHLPTSAQFESFTTYSKNITTQQYDIPSREFFVEYYSKTGSFFIESTFDLDMSDDTANVGYYFLKSMFLEVTTKPPGFSEKDLLAKLGYSPLNHSEEEKKLNKSISRWEGREKNIQTWQKMVGKTQHFIEVGYPIKRKGALPYYCDFYYYIHKRK
jgi:hypothetical protein